MDHAISDAVFTEGGMSAIYVWAILIVATLGSWFVTEDTEYAKLGSASVVIIAAIKINLVVSHFMELRWRPLPYRIIVSGWLTFVTMIIVGSYLAV